MESAVEMTAPQGHHQEEATPLFGGNIAARYRMSATCAASSGDECVWGGLGGSSFHSGGSHIGPLPCMHEQDMSCLLRCMQGGWECCYLLACDPSPTVACPLLSFPLVLSFNTCLSHHHTHRPHDNSCPPHPPAACSHPHFSYIDDRELTELQLPSLQVSSISHFRYPRPATVPASAQHLPDSALYPPLLCKWPICPAPAACWIQPCTLHPPPLLYRWPICPARPVSPS